MFGASLVPEFMVVMASMVVLVINSDAKEMVVAMVWLWYSYDGDEGSCGSGNILIVSASGVTS